MKLGWIGPTVVIIGVVVAGAAVIYWRHAQPVPGAEIDRVECNGGTMVVRAEEGGERSFVELHDPHGDLVWEALIPHYAGTKGRPALACGATAATVRVERSGRAEVFGFAMANGQKVGGFRLAIEHEPVHTAATGPVTVTDHVRSYEVVGGDDWHQIVAVDLTTGKGAWKVDLGPAAVTDASVEGGKLVVRQGSSERVLDAATGRDEPVTKASN